MKPGTIPLGILAILFALFQVWWIGMTIINGRLAEKAVKKRKEEKIELKRNQLENLLKK
tara:strand:+ start:417 stop:593 length:177 start_codon:yes stop_codon:yes gene_type:complete